MQTERISLALPFGLGAVSLVPNTTEQRAAWALYVELKTRVATQPFDAQYGSLRSSLDSLYSLFPLTRQILREAGPDVVHPGTAFGLLAIDILTQGLAPFLNRWHPALGEYERIRPETVSPAAHEREWDEYEALVEDLKLLQREMRHYSQILLSIARGTGEG